MNILDIGIIVLVIAYGAVGFRRGVFKQTIMTVGSVGAFVLAFYLKNPVASFLSLNLPFWDFRDGLAKGLTSLNILFYQIIAFLIVLAVLFAIVMVLVKLASGIEKALRWTIILGIPSKILGFIVGAIEGYILAFIALFVLSLPFINASFIDNSSLMPKILNSSPVLTNVVEDTNDAVVDIYHEIKSYKSKDRTSLNLSIIKLLLKYDVIDKEYLKELRDAGKLNIAGINSLV